MIEMIIADDEPIITKGLKNIIGWKQLGIHIAGCYENGKDALHGILSQKADIALLDISMPEMSGIEVLKELRRIDVETKVIFISGFHEFEYARSALEYGAQGYLLKPVIKEELIGMIEKCVEELGGSNDNLLKEQRIAETYGRLVDPEDTDYTLVLINILFQSKTPQERKLVEFSVISYIEKYVEGHQLGVLFRKAKGNFIVFRESDTEIIWEHIKKINQGLHDAIGYSIQGIIGPVMNSLGEIPQVYQECLEWAGYFFFMQSWNKEILVVDTPVTLRKVTKEELMEALGNLMDSMIQQEYEQMLKQFKWYQDLIAILSNGSKEDACYYFCLGITEIGKRLDKLDISHEEMNTAKLLREGRKAYDFLEMSEVYKKHVLNCYKSIQASVDRNTNKDIQLAKKYINEHYKENLSLKILADVMCMNSYYFSSFFKKNSGMNFKDFLNEIRLERAVSLLISTDKRIIDIAAEVGFSDERSFSKAFRKKYAESPMTYKRKILSPDHNVEKAEEADGTNSKRNLSD